MEQMKNIHLLPTSQPSRLTIRLKTNELMYSYKEFVNQKYEEISLNQNQHIYITNNEEIKEGDWCINKHNVVYKQETDKIFTEFTGSKKIILTTDQNLDGVQAIDTKFLEWFVKNPSCESVDVKSESSRKFGMWKPECYPQIYKIIIPKEEPKQETLEEVECNNCGYLMSLTEDESVYACYNSECKSCYEEYEEEPKQETLEEAAVKYSNNFVEDESKYFIKGAKWQSERMYSEEDMIEFAKYCNLKDDLSVRELLVIWFEQFKKK